MVIDPGSCKEEFRKAQKEQENSAIEADDSPAANVDPSAVDISPSQSATVTGDSYGVWHESWDPKEAKLYNEMNTALEKTLKAQAGNPVYKVLDWFNLPNREILNSHKRHRDAFTCAMRDLSPYTGAKYLAYVKRFPEFRKHLNRVQNGQKCQKTSEATADRVRLKLQKLVEEERNAALREMGHRHDPLPASFASSSGLFHPPSDSVSFHTNPLDSQSHGGATANTNPPSAVSLADSRGHNPQAWSYSAGESGDISEAHYQPRTIYNSSFPHVPTTLNSGLAPLEDTRTGGVYSLWDTSAEARRAPSWAIGSVHYFKRQRLSSLRKPSAEGLSFRPPLWDDSPFKDSWNSIADKNAEHAKRQEEGTQEGQ
ncbi:hypothetical protein QFC21_005297 [Naganishia friedmannii]|uniref:Uncharacterized protein n=1 Tax=Naganishia friedmannii TaxID=89922 RepID=A0ACC2VAU1_9TREE|nr:hypothetical protein QFC21_005297 [Naganishia friedmannii]